jgi:Yip1 domain
LPVVGANRSPIGSAITSAIMSYGLTLAGIYLLGLVIDGLAPTFGGTRHPVQALKVAAYSGTALWLAGVFALLPGLRLLTILGLYSLYLLYLGLPLLMKSPVERAPSYTVMVVLAGAVVFMLTDLVGAVAGRFLAGPPMGMMGR